MPTGDKFAIENEPNGRPAMNGSIPAGSEPALIGKLPKWVRLKASRAVFDILGEIVCRYLMDPSILELHRLLQTSDEWTGWREFQNYHANKMPTRSMDSAFAMSQIGG